MRDLAPQDCRLLISLLSVLVLLSFGSSASADRFVAPIPDLIGLHQYDEASSNSFDFGFGTEFQDVSAVWLEVEATGTPLEYDLCGTVDDPQPCEHVVQPAVFVAILDDEELPSQRFIWALTDPFGETPARQQVEFSVSCCCQINTTCCQFCC